MNLMNGVEFNWVSRDRWPIVIKYMFLIGVVLISYFFIRYFFIASLLTRYEGLVIEETRLQQVYKNQYKQIVNLEGYEKQLQEMNQRFSFVLKQLPIKNTDAGLLETISKIGVSSGLSIEQFSPGTELKHPFYVELPVNIKVEGSYNQLVVFLNRVAKLNQMVSVHDFTINSFISKSSHSFAYSEDTISRGLSAGSNNVDRYLDPADKHREASYLIMHFTIKLYRYPT